MANKHQIADQQRWQPLGWINYPWERETPIETVDPRNKAGLIANRFIARLLAMPRS